MLLWIIGFSLLGSIGAIAGAALLLFFPDGVRKTLVPSLISYATGTLLGAAFLGVIPASLELAPAPTVLATVLAGMVLFFVLEKLVLWRHCHDTDCEVHGRAGALILIGDASPQLRRWRCHCSSLSHVHSAGDHRCAGSDCARDTAGSG